MKLLLLCLFVAVARASLAPIVTTSERSVPDSWMIKVKDFDQLDVVEEKIKELFSSFRSAPPTINKLKKLLPVMNVKVPKFMISKLRSIEGIEEIHEDTINTIMGSQSNAPWGLDRIDSRTGTNGVYNYNDNRQGSGVTIYVVDTGINTNHVSFGGRASLLYGASDDNGHGTHCAGTAGGDIYGIARQATIKSSKVCDGSGSCPTSLIAAGLDAVVSDYSSSDDAVISMSLGGFGSHLNSYVQTAINAGITASVAAGNSNFNACYYTPASLSAAITVGATDSSDVRAYFSNYGSCVDLFAPGVNILSADYVGNSGAKSLSGTSMACPHVSGAAAVYLGVNPGSSPAQVASGLVNAATDGAVSDLVGSPNKLLYVAP